MATRLNKRHQQSVRDLIDTQGLVKRLQNHARGETEMSKTQIQAAQILLNKTISNAPTEIDNHSHLDLVSKIELVIVDPIL